MQLSVDAKPVHQFQGLLNEGFRTTQSIVQDIEFQLKNGDSDYNRVAIVDVSELVLDIERNEKFDTLTKWFPLLGLLECCSSFDDFYNTLNDINEVEVDDEDRLTQDTLNQLDEQGCAFVQKYREGFLKPVLDTLKAGDNYFIQGVTPNMECIVRY